MKIILGSSSHGRKTELEERGYAFEIMKPGIDEKAIRTTDNYELPLLLARAKLEALMPRISDQAIVITADQVVVCNGQLFEKPESPEEAKRFLSEYSAGHAGETVSALVVLNTVTGKRAEGIDIAKTYYRPIPGAVMDEYILKEDPFSKAGGYFLESEILAPYLDRVEGGTDSVRGMPIHLLEKLFAEVGVPADQKPVIS